MSTANINQSLQDIDPEVYGLIGDERVRQEDGLELIASENYASMAVMRAQGTVLTNKYAEGYPGKRYYGGCSFVDNIETIAIERAKKLFGASYANVQAHSGSQANMAAYMALLEPGDKIMGMDLSQGGHLTHGSPVNFSGRLFKVISYGIDYETDRINYKEIAEIANKERPKLIVAGASAYPRAIDFAQFREIADSINAYLMVDMAHIAGLIATGLHPSPIPHAHVVTSTTHKTLRGPRGGIILTNHEEVAKKLDFNIFPGIQGGPLEHVIAAKAVALKEALHPDFTTYQKQVVSNAKTLAESLDEEDLSVISGGTDNHMLLVRTDTVGVNGKMAEHCLEKAHITCNKNMIPGDTRSPFIASGIRLGTPAVTTRGLVNEHMVMIAEWISSCLKNHTDDKVIEETKQSVIELCRQFPVYPDIGG